MTHGSMQQVQHTDSNLTSCASRLNRTNVPTKASVSYDSYLAAAATIHLGGCYLHEGSVLEVADAVPRSGDLSWVQSSLTHAIGQSSDQSAVCYVAVVCSFRRCTEADHIRRDVSTQETELQKLEEKRCASPLTSSVRNSLVLLLLLLLASLTWYDWVALQCS